jgi:hypothetical protein
VNRRTLLLSSLSVASQLSTLPVSQPSPQRDALPTSSAAKAVQQNQKRRRAEGAAGHLEWVCGQDALGNVEGKELCLRVVAGEAACHLQVGQVQEEAQAGESTASAEGGGEAEGRA